MKRTQDIKMKLDAILGKQKLSDIEMKAINGGFSCYCNGVFQGNTTSTTACCAACKVTC